MEFIPFPKLARLNRDIVITEKLDGTNAQVYITDDGSDMLVGSRTRWITPEADNFGFARWCYENRDELMKLGPGSHFGEWWGKGIQRGYGMEEKKFSLFNTHRWKDSRPACCDVVPILYEGPFSEGAVVTTVDWLRSSGSVAVPGYMKPEGVVVFHTAANLCFKVTCVDDNKPKTWKEHNATAN
jgi:hypothetical protein